MGEHDVTGRLDSGQQRAFMRALLEDVQALERMLNEGCFETGIRRIGAEQEMFLVDRSMSPARIALKVLAELPPDHFTTELAQFNLEANLSPQVFGGDCLSRMEEELLQFVAEARAATAKVGRYEVLLTGILPTLERSHLGLDHMTPIQRYYQLNQAMSEVRGGQFDVRIKGLDELQTQHDNVMLEACNTSFQVHFQVAPAEFVRLYNLAQVVTAPVLAAAVNSPVLLQHRLWHETRVALFQQSVDARSSVQQARGQRTRVSFGDGWVKESVLEIFREDIARFRVMLAVNMETSPLDMLDRGEIPPLTALRLHNGTIYRWNRACYGVGGPKPHLRIENRVLPAGPTVLDEMANAAFFFGLMSALADEYGDVTKVISFDDAKSNFVTAARYGLKASFQWIRGVEYKAEELILAHLLPKARAGLQKAGIDSADIDRYLGVIRDRVSSGRTGAQWALDSLAGMGNKARKDERYRALTSAILEKQKSEQPVHTWSLAEITQSSNLWRQSYRLVKQVMTTDLFTVHPEDVVDLAANLMDWEHIRHVPVEDDQGRLVGLVSHRSLLRLIGKRRKLGDDKLVTIKEVMRTNPITVTPDSKCLDCIELMRRAGVSAVPVVENERLVGIVTERDFIEVAAVLLEALLRETDHESEMDEKTGTARPA